jgi:hypothetical protein
VVGVGIVAYVPILRFGHPDRWKEYWGMIIRLRSKQPPLPETAS